MATDLANIVSTATPNTGVKLRAAAYGKNGIRVFLRDVIAMANASVDGARYIIVGAEIDKKGGKRLHSISQTDFSGKPAYVELVTDFIEPTIRLTYRPVNVDGKRIGVFEIGDCQDRPYMMRVDHSEMLRRGDAYIRVDDAPVKMGRQLLQDMFERKFNDSVSAERVEIGFPGEIIHKDMKVKTIDLSQMPSAIAGTNLQELVNIQANAKGGGSTAAITRLTHARLYGSDRPYETRTPEELMAELAQIEALHRNNDEHFLFESNAKKLQLVVYNQGDEPIQDASLSILMPNHNALYVAIRLPKIRRDGEYVDRTRRDLARYPTVKLKDDAIHVSNSLGEIPTDAPVNAFEVPLRICVGSDLKGRKLGIRYSLFGSNLRALAKGKLRLLF